MSGLKPKNPDQPAAAPIDPGCLEVCGLPVMFVRFESRRQRVALPYAALLKVELSLDETEMVLGFATHRVIVQGRRLRAVYEAVSLAQAVQIAVARDSMVMLSAQRGARTLVTEIIVEPLQESERSRR